MLCDTRKYSVTQVKNFTVYYWKLYSFIIMADIIFLFWNKTYHIICKTLVPFECVLHFFFHHTKLTNNVLRNRIAPWRCVQMAILNHCRSHSFFLDVMHKKRSHFLSRIGSLSSSPLLSWMLITWNMKPVPERSSLFSWCLFYLQFSECSWYNMLDLT